MTLKRWHTLGAVTVAFLAVACSAATGPAPYTRQVSLEQVPVKQVPTEVASNATSDDRAAAFVGRSLAEQERDDRTEGQLVPENEAARTDYVL